eukprot:GFYU01030119.1.p1 GENE.GFYU01030119.1~~GFYU01030119.1.p1  ORF type:complete len:254 (+),score=54.54 GFYU01030119.1:32-763(+)
MVTPTETAQLPDEIVIEWPMGKGLMPQDLEAEEPHALRWLHPESVCVHVEDWPQGKQLPDSEDAVMALDSAAFYVRADFALPVVQERDPEFRGEEMDNPFVTDRRVVMPVWGSLSAASAQSVLRVLRSSTPDESKEAFNEGVFSYLYTDLSDVYPRSPDRCDSYGEGTNLAHCFLGFRKGREHPYLMIQRPYVLEERKDLFALFVHQRMGILPEEIARLQTTEPPLREEGEVEGDSKKECVVM